MAWWKFWQPRADKLDGYVPAQSQDEDPWNSPEIKAAISERVRMDNMDGFKNELTGIGDWMRDKTFGGMQSGPMFEVRLLSSVDCENRWRGSDLGGRIVETIPDEMTREGWDIQIQPSDEDDAAKTDAFPPQQQANPMMPPPIEQGPKPLPEFDDSGAMQAEELLAKLDKLSAEDMFWEALSFERAYGGGAILLGADDGKQLKEPLDEKNIKEVRHLTAFRGGWDGELIAWSYYNDPTKPNYGMPETYMLRNLGVPVARIPVPGERLNVEPLPPQTSSYNIGGLLYWVHESRLLIFPGVAVTRRVRTQLRGWGDSVFTRVDQVLSQYDQTWGGIANLMTDFSQGVLSVDGLAEVMAGNNKNGTKMLTNRAMGVQMARSIARLLIIDKEETFARDTVSLGGIGEVLQQFSLRLAAAADMPVDLLMGQTAAGGLNKGDTTLRFFYDRIAARQKKRMLPQLRRLVRVLMLAGDSPTEGEEPEKWSVSFKPLYQETAAEKAARYLQIAQADHIYVTDGVVSPEEVAATRFGGSEYDDGAIEIDLEGRDEMAKQAELDKVKQEKAAKEAMKQPKPEAAAAAKPGEDKPTSSEGGGHTVTVNVGSK